MESDLTNSMPELAAVSAPGVSFPLQFVHGELQRPKISLRYRLGLAAVSLAMVLLPVLYVALIIAFAYAVYFYAVNFQAILEWPLRGMTGWTVKLLAYFGPLFVGTLLAFFLVKPLFARRAEQRDHFSLNHADAPQLFSLIGWICRSLDAPIPSRIDVNCSVNASAGFRAGARSIFGNDIILTLGLPLIAGMDLGQFAAVVAHEYGHFSQGAGMRASYLIRQINSWFFRVVHERDAWDLQLIDASHDERASVSVFFYFARLGVWFARSILWVFMALGQALSCFLDRQMEFDADRYATRTSGAQSFIQMIRRLHQLHLGSLAAGRQLATTWKKEKKLFDQIPEFIVSRADEIPAETQDRHYVKAFKRKTGLFDTHPSDTERIQRALQANDAGVFHSTAPAGSLFADFPALSRKITLAYYRGLIGRDFSPALLISVEQTRRQAGHDGAADRQHIQRYFLGVAAPFRPMALPETQALTVPSRAELMVENRYFRRRMEQLLPAAREAVAAFNDADARLLLVWQASHLLQAGFQFDPADFYLADTEAGRAQAEAWEAQQEALAGLQPFENAGKARLANALRLLRLPAAGRVPNAAQLQDEAREMIWVLARLGEVFEGLLQLRKDSAALEALLQRRRNRESADNLEPVLENLCAGLQENINQIQQKLSYVRHPFQRAAEQVTVSDYARNKEYDPDRFEQVLREGRSHCEKLFALHDRLAARLIAIGEQAEKAVLE
jgi:Zn-dependent protease with chaperone function